MLDKNQLQIENERLLLESQARERFLTSLSRITAAINSTLRLEEILSILCSEVIQIFDIEGAAIYVFDHPTLKLHLKASRGIMPAGQETLTLEESSHFLVRTFLTGKPLVTTNSSGVGLPGPYLEAGWKSALAMPLIREKRGLGILLLGSARPERFSDEDLEQTGMLADHTAIALNNTMLFEKQMQKSSQLEIAIQEAHHRIKNNLQTVAVLLDLQKGECDEPRAKQALEESIERINSISLVHELLSKDSDVRAIDTRVLLDKLITVVATTARNPKQQISIEVQSESILISSKRATALALIAHELIANAMEHGLAGRSHGSILVSLTKSGSRVTFSVRDDGAGLPEAFSPHRDGRIGLSVVRALAERDLSGDIHFNNLEPGLEATVYFEDAGLAGDV